MAITKLVITGNTTAVGLSSDPLTISLVERTLANSVLVAPDDNITATNVQDALEQLDDIKAPIASPSFTGNVAIGTDSAQSKLHVQASSSGATGVADGTLIVEQGSAPSIQILSANSQTQSIKFGDPEDGDVGKINYSHADNHMGLFTNGTEALRIDSDGVALSGKTAHNFNAQGAEFRSSPTTNQSTATFTRDGFNAVAFNRLTNDGSIVDFSKDGTTVGSIGTKGGELFIAHDGTIDSGLRFQGNGTIIPVHSTGSSADNAQDLGATLYRFKDLFLSGGVHLGGTGDANKLDDYEEGTWTPAASGYGGTMTVNSAAYTKIGRLVHLRASVTFSNTSDGSIIQITGLPFAQGTADTGRGGSVTRDTSGSVAFTDGSASTVLRMLSNTHSTVTYTAVKEATVEFFHIYDA